MATAFIYRRVHRVGKEMDALVRSRTYTHLGHDEHDGWPVVSTEEVLNHVGHVVGVWFEVRV